MTTKKEKFILLILAAVLVLWIAWGNTALELSTYKINASRLPESFDGYRIAHVSDLHNRQMGKDNEKLLSMLRKAEPDLIAITGDLIDSRSTKVDVALRFLQEAVKIAPCYYVTGNHESRVSEYAELKAGMSAIGVTVLEDASVDIRRSDNSITLIGLHDPRFQTASLPVDSKTVTDEKLAALHTDGAGFTVVLSHRPELFETYAAHDVDLVLSGHAHGGQIRLPFIGGVVAPHQGLFPEFDAGLYTDGNTNMFVSRGVGNSLFPLRINNRPEVLLIELSSKK